MNGLHRRRWVSGQWDQGGKERWRELGVSDCKKETAEPDGLKITTGGFQTEKGKLLCLGMLKIHEVVQKGAVAKT